MDKTVKPSSLAVTDPELIRSFAEQTRPPKHVAERKRAAKIKRARKRMAFRAKWARIPAAWRDRLQRTRSAHALKLAITVLFEAFRAEQCGTDIVLSSQITGLQGTSRKRAIKELERLGLIRTKRKGRQAPKIEVLHYY